MYEVQPLFMFEAKGFYLGGKSGIPSSLPVTQLNNCRGVTIEKKITTAKDSLGLI
jgi:hypothetical protein